MTLLSSGRGSRCRRRGFVPVGRRGGPMKKHAILRVALAGAVVVAAHAAAGAVELRIFGSRVTKMVIGDLGPGFEQASGHKLTVLTHGPTVMKRRSERGE